MEVNSDYQNYASSLIVGSSSSNGEDPTLANFLVLISAILGGNGNLGNLNLNDPQTNFIMAVLANLVANSPFLADLAKGATPLDQQLEAALSDTTYGNSLLQDFQAIAQGGSGAQKAVNHIVSLLTVPGSGVNTFLSGIRNAGLSYSFSGSNGSQFQGDMYSFAGRFSTMLGALGDALNNGEAKQANDIALSLSDYVTDLYNDANANPQDPLSLLILSILTTDPMEPNGQAGDSIWSLASAMESGTFSGNPQEFFNELNGSGGDLGLVSILQNLTTYWPNNFHPSSP